MNVSYDKGSCPIGLMVECDNIEYEVLDSIPLSITNFSMATSNNVELCPVSGNTIAPYFMRLIPTYLYMSVLLGLSKVV